MAASDAAPGSQALAPSAVPGTAVPGTAVPGTADPGAVPAPGSAPPAPPGRPTLSDRLPRPWLFPLLVFAGAWLLIVATWHGANLVYHPSEPWSWYFGYKDAGM